MTSQERLLYHQIHPLKLATDWSTAFVALYPTWHHAPLPAAVIAILPSVVVTLALIRFADLEWLKASAFGAYLRRHMTRTVEGVRFAGFGVMLVAAWQHRAWAIALGVAIILLAWAHGLWRPDRK
jgi:hypothetical protein